MFFNFKETLIASLILLLSGSFFLINFFQLRQTIQDGGVLISGIQLGKTNFNLMQGETCFGQLKFETTEDQLMGLKTSLKLDVLIEERTETVDVYGESYYNPLGQLVGSKTRLVYQGQRSFLETEGVNPMFVRLSGTHQNIDLKQRFTLPGPVELVLSDDDQTFKLVYSQLASLQAMAPTREMESFSSLSAFNISIAPGEPCDSPVALNMNPILFLLKKLNGGYG
jgi:hypothetical protein